MGEAIAGIAESPKDCQPDADFIGPVVIKKLRQTTGQMIVHDGVCEIRDSIAYLQGFGQVP